MVAFCFDAVSYLYKNYKNSTRNTHIFYPDPAIIYLLSHLLLFSVYMCILFFWNNLKLSWRYCDPLFLNISVYSLRTRTLSYLNHSKDIKIRKFNIDTINYLINLCSNFIPYPNNILTSDSYSQSRIQSRSCMDPLISFNVE